MLDYPIRTERLLLRPYENSDVDDVFAYQSLDEVSEFQYWESRTREDVEKIVMEWGAKKGNWATDDALPLAVELQTTGRVIGDVVIQFKDKAARQGEIGYSLHPDFQRQGIGSEAIAKLLDIGFVHFDLHRIYARCDALNKGSWGLLERLNFRREAHFKEHALFKGRWDEEFYYALLKREWMEQTGRT